MANILQSLGDAMERQQRRRRETNMEILRAIYTRPGMIVLGTILLVAALTFIWPQIAPEDDNSSSIVIDMNDFDFGDEEMNRAVREIVENDRKQKEQSGRTGAIFFGFGASACYIRAVLPWKKKEQTETVTDGSASKEAEETPVPPKSEKSAAPQSVEIDSREDRLENLKRLYEAGILSREEYDERRKKL